jgi:ABC-type multidrug transport system ATPase subunit
MKYAVSTYGLAKVYGDKIKALNGINLKVKLGNISTFLGLNRIGKTTLMRILTIQIKSTFYEAHVFRLNIFRNNAVQCDNVHHCFNKLQQNDKMIISKIKEFAI